jgi:hypothetical protein
MKEPTRIDLPESEAKELLQRLQKGELIAKDYEILGGVLKSWLWLSSAVRDKAISIRELKKLIFGAKTEKSSNLVKARKRKSKQGEKPPKKKGHGRNGSDAYTGAERYVWPCTEFCAGDGCPKCEKGKLYPYTPSEIVCIRGQAPLQSTVHEVEQLRCNLCGAWFKGTPPPEAHGPKYDATAGSMMVLLRYGGGFPHNRLASLQANLGTPLPSSTQWDVIHKEPFNAAQPVGEELLRQAANAELFHNDDTTARVLDLKRTIEQEVEASNQSKQRVRTGIFTTGIIAKLGTRLISLFFTGRQHAGENLTKVLDERTDGLSPPIQMCDALSRNAPKDFARLLAHCLCHGRRNFAKLIEDFPDHCQHVLDTLREVYKCDAIAKKKDMSDEQRLRFHQQFSGPIMNEFFGWLQDQQKIIEPNSRMGEAISYMIDHWEALTLFLRVPGAPLDNNVAERALKMSIRHRKNSLFYKTEHGAAVGDLFMSLIHTCRLNGINAFDYLTALQLHAELVKASPKKWLPWNYHDTRRLCTAP